MNLLEEMVTVNVFEYDYVFQSQHRIHTDAFDEYRKIARLRIKVGLFRTILDAIIHSIGVALYHYEEGWQLL
ncbi:MAG: hypothetical protein ACFFED_06180 [Candidatus Thorarchaeota archaeon]